MVDEKDPKAVAAWEKKLRSTYEPYGVSKLEDMLRNRQVGTPQKEKFVRDILLPEMRKNEAVAREAQDAKETQRQDELRAIAQTEGDHAAKANEHAAEANEIARQARNEARKSVNVGRWGVGVAALLAIIALIALVA